LGDARNLTENLRADLVHTIAQLLDRYALEHLPTLAPKTMQSRQISIRKLRPVFGHMPIGALRPVHVYRYRDCATKAHGPRATNLDIATLSHAYTKAVEWGYVDRNPIKGQVAKNSRPPRDRYIEDWEIDEALRVCEEHYTDRRTGRMLALYIELKLLTGLRRSDMLQLRFQDVRNDGIHVQPQKTALTTGKKLIIIWDENLRAVVNEIRALRRRVGSIYLFCNRQGQCYYNPEKGTASGFDSIWSRFMVKLLERSKVTERFHEHDLRAKSASDDLSVENAAERLAHASTATTRRHYRRKPSKVSPLKR